MNEQPEGDAPRASGHATEQMGRPPSVPQRVALLGELVAGTLLAGRYRLVRRLGEGGMGEVWEARHEELDKRVAVKLLLSSMQRDPHEVERFLREAKAAARIHHPNIVSVIDLGREDSGLPFIVMELLEGRSLGDAMESALPWSRVRPILLEVTSALAAAHAQGIVHRDLKPSNIHLSPRPDGTESAKLIDFGIAKLSTLDAADAATFTRTGAVLGTPAYMSPEQIAGRKDIDHRTDIYSLGVLCFEMLAGRLPFSSENMTSLITMHLMQPPPELPPPIDLGVHGAQVQAIVRRMLCKDPVNRFRDMDELRDAISAVGTQTAPVAVPNEHYGAIPGHLADLAGVPSRPAASMQPQAAAARLEPVSARASANVIVWIVAGVLMLAAVGGGIGLVVSQLDRTGSSVEEEEVAGLVSCEIRIRTPDASVTNALGENVPVVNGRVRLQLPRSDTATWITIAARDHTPETLEIVPNRDQSHSIALRPALPESE